MTGIILKSIPSPNPTITAPRPQKRSALPAISLSNLFKAAVVFSLSAAVLTGRYIRKDETPKSEGSIQTYPIDSTPSCQISSSIPFCPELKAPMPNPLPLVENTQRSTQLPLEPSSSEKKLFTENNETPLTPNMATRVIQTTASSIKFASHTLKSGWDHAGKPITYFTFKAVYKVAETGSKTAGFFADYDPITLRTLGALPILAYGIHSTLKLPHSQ